MADITPVTREEMYLAKAGGQDVPTPTPVPGEEQYLAKLSGQDVNVPTPIKRREKFLYAASGGDIELPSEDKMRRIEKFMAKAGGMDVSTPTAVTRLEKFWANVVEAGGRKTITGTLPLTFTAKGGAAADWVIYGNAQGVGERTKNLLDIVTISGTRYDVEYTTNKTAGTYTLNGTATNSYFNDIATFIAEAGKGYVLSGCAEGGGSSYRLYTKIGGTNYFDTGDGVTLPILDTDTTVTIRIAVYSGAVCDNVVMKPMVREANTSDTFIPYGYQIPLTVSQQGQPDKNYDIYIGDSPLTEGETVSKTSTGVDIELFGGENTVSTTLYNKPKMMIKYKE